MSKGEWCHNSPNAIRVGVPLVCAALWPPQGAGVSTPERGGSHGSDELHAPDPARARLRHQLPEGRLGRREGDAELREPAVGARPHHVRADSELRRGRLPSVLVPRGALRRPQPLAPKNRDGQELRIRLLRLRTDAGGGPDWRHHRRHLRLDSLHRLGCLHRRFPRHLCGRHHHADAHDHGGRAWAMAST